MTRKTFIQLLPYIAVFVGTGVLFNACCGQRVMLDGVVDDKLVGGLSGYQVKVFVAEHDLTTTFDVNFADWVKIQKGQKVKVSYTQTGQNPVIHLDLQDPPPEAPEPVEKP